MQTYVVLGYFTNQGVRSAKGSPSRAKAFRESSEKLGVHVRELFWMMGQYDFIVLADAPDDETITASLLKLATYATPAHRRFAHLILTQ